MDKVVDPAMTALDYPQAPLRQLMAAPAKIAKGDFIGAIADPIRQLGRSPKEAPTSAQVLEMYGVPKEKKVSPIGVTNPLMATSYEMNPDDEDPTNETIYPSSQGAMLLDTVVGGEGINLVTKGIGKVGKGISKTAQAVAEATSPARSKAQTEAIIEAAKRIGVKVTPAMLDDTKFVQRLEYTLANSPSGVGQSIARKQDAVAKGMQTAAKNLTSEATTLSPYDIGEGFKKGINASVAERLDPISETFNEISKNTQASKITPESKQAIVRNILKLDDYRLTAGQGRPSQYVEMLGRAENANDVKKIISYINDDLKTVSGPEKFTLIQMKDKLLNLEKNTVTRAAVQTARDLGMKGKEGEQIGKQLMADLKGARKGYAELSSDLKNASESARLKSGGPLDTLDKIEKIPSENIQSKFFNVDNNRQLKALQEKFPEQFDLLRQGKLKDIAEKSIDYSLKGKGETSTANFLKELRNLNPEAKQMLFGKNSQAIDDLKTLQSSLPENFNPPSSANQMGWKDAIVQNVKDVPNYVLYRGATSNLGKKISEGTARAVNASKDIPEIPESLRQVPNLAGKSSSILNEFSRGGIQSVASNEPTKGPEKWIREGSKKLLESDSSISPEIIERLKKDIKGRELLYQASDVSPNSKAMENIKKKIRTGYLNKGDQ